MSTSPTRYSATSIEGFLDTNMEYTPKDSALITQALKLGDDEDCFLRYVIDYAGECLFRQYTQYRPVTIRDALAFICSDDNYDAIAAMLYGNNIKKVKMRMDNLVGTLSSVISQKDAPEEEQTCSDVLEIANICCFHGNECGDSDECNVRCCISENSSCARVFDDDNYVEALMITTDFVHEVQGTENLEDYIGQKLNSHLRAGRPWNNRMIVTAEEDIEDDVWEAVCRVAYRKRFDMVRNQAYIMFAMKERESGNGNDIGARYSFWIPSISSSSKRKNRNQASIVNPDETLNELTVLFGESAHDNAQSILPTFCQIGLVSDMRMDNMGLDKKKIAARLRKDVTRKGKNGNALYLNRGTFGDTVLSCILFARPSTEEEHRQILDKWCNGPYGNDVEDPGDFISMMNKIGEENNWAEAVIVNLDECREKANGCAGDLLSMTSLNDNDMIERSINKHKLEVMRKKVRDIVFVMEASEEAIAEALGVLGKR